MRDEVYSGSVEYVQLLDADGDLDGELPDGLEEDDLKEMYQEMVTAREFDERAVKLQRRGDMGTYAPLKGQEAAQVGSAYAMDDDDWMVPAYREGASYFTRGVPMEKLLQYWGGDERGAEMDGEDENLPPSVPVGSQVIHGAGIAMSMKRHGDDKATLTYLGDGATSEGAFHSGMNWAGSFDVPAVFFVQNNQYAISVPRDEQTGADTIAQKALAYGMDGVQVDGNDPVAVWQVTNEALERAREDGEPTLIEAVTYRRGDHTTADDASKYRDEDEVEEWREKDPIDRLEAFLADQGVPDDWFEEQQELAEEQVSDAIDAYQSMEDQDLEDLFDHHYAETPPELERQKQELLATEDETGGDA
ncbi:MAG: pyruvate dehydrogenase (acetyl-transferring) E1 component subunit alpha [Candidatus Nanohaloarchaea archaeon]|nr:pyruvate dehydrogenase (acetyl-transferring) E1 component subunit alpha [Candidatus Nanohaloarchaea archaeon]